LFTYIEEGIEKYPDSVTLNYWRMQLEDEVVVESDEENHSDKEKDDKDDEDDDDDDDE